MSSSLLCQAVTWPLLVCLWMLENSTLGLFCPKCSGGDLLPPSGVSFPIGTLGVGRLLCGRTGLSPSGNQGTCYLKRVNGDRKSRPLTSLTHQEQQRTRLAKSRVIFLPPKVPACDIATRPGGDTAECDLEPESRHWSTKVGPSNMGARISVDVATPRTAQL
uniref:Secreted protein n=1 Tax=Felis catus TaxID=9685 RepID=A0ABI7WHU8_FELCA